jgi:quercetin dioxygenase-like cupin family protein
MSATRRAAVLHLRSLPRVSKVAHDGAGEVEVAQVVPTNELASALEFIEYVEVPPGASIGHHRHGADEEVYVVLDGRATMTIENERHDVSSGDLILNPSGGAHGLVNDSAEPVRLLIWQVPVQR